VRVKRPQPRTVIATPQEIDALLRHAAPWMRTIILLALHAGLRRSDCMRVAPIHYSAEKRTITIEQKKTARTVVLPVTKTLADHLERIETADPTEPFYAALRGKPLRGTALDDHWRELKKKAGVNPGLWIHDLRRTAAVTLYQLTKDLTAVEAFLGHATLNATCGYLEHKDPAKLKPYLDQMWKFHPEKETVQ
jgi:integrase